MSEGTGARPGPTPEGELIAFYLRRSGLSVREAARRTGISEGWWRQIQKGYQSLSGGGYGPVKGPPETLAKMALTLGVPPQRLTDIGRPDAATALNRLTGESAVTDESMIEPKYAEPWKRRIWEIVELTEMERRIAIASVEAFRTVGEGNGAEAQTRTA